MSRVHTVALTSSGDLLKSVRADSPTEAAEIWAEWYLRTGKGTTLSECFVQEFPGVWRSYELTIEDKVT